MVYAESHGNGLCRIKGQMGMVYAGSHGNGLCWVKSQMEMVYAGSRVKWKWSMQGHMVIVCRVQGSNWNGLCRARVCDSLFHFFSDAP